MRASRRNGTSGGSLRVPQITKWELCLWACLVGCVGSATVALAQQGQTQPLRQAPPSTEKSAGDRALAQPAQPTLPTQEARKSAGTGESISERLSHDAVAGNTGPASPMGRSSGRGALRHREGEVVELTGRFAFAGERVTFTAEEGNISFRVLENLALERVLQYLEENAANAPRRLWSVVGRVTEFRGTNYLLLERAVLKRASPSDGR